VAPTFYFSHPSWSLMYDVPDGAFLDLQSVNKFGRTTNADSGVATDIWDAANATEDDDIWVAPTQARVHAITSNDGGDTAAGAGARTIRVYGLRSWDSTESFEDITMNGAGAVNTVNSYVIIHRMRVLTSGATSANIGDIFATAAVDGTITAMIVATEGQTQMAVYGIPSSQTAYVTKIYASLNRAVATAQGNLSLLWCFDVKNQPTVFQVKHTMGLSTTGTSAISHDYKPYSGFTGPGILKLQVVAGQNDCDVSGGFDLLLEDRP
jgi:hypothetical protein